MTVIAFSVGTVGSSHLLWRITPNVSLLWESGLRLHMRSCGVLSCLQFYTLIILFRWHLLSRMTPSWWKWGKSWWMWWCTMCLITHQNWLRLLWHGLWVNLLWTYTPITSGLTSHASNAERTSPPNKIQRRLRCLHKKITKFLFQHVTHMAKIYFPGVWYWQWHCMLCLPWCDFTWGQIMDS